MSDAKRTNHYRYVCRYCRAPGFQCRCSTPAGTEKKTRWTTCRECERKLGNGQKLVPVPESL